MLDKIKRFIKRLWYANYQEPEATLGAPTSASYRDLLPFADSTYDLGSNTKRWANVYADNYDGVDLSGYVPQHKAGANPTANDDSANTSGNGTFTIGDLWLNTNDGGLFQVRDTTPTTAEWREVAKLNADGDLEGILIPRSGTATEIDAIVLQGGEVAVTTDTNQLRIGDGITGGGNAMQSELYDVNYIPADGTIGIAPTPIITTGTDISFSTIFGLSRRINRVTGSWVDDGFVTGMVITVTGSVNTGPYTLTGVSATSLSLTSSIWTNESAGAEVTVTSILTYPQFQFTTDRLLWAGNVRFQNTAGTHYIDISNSAGYPTLTPSGTDRIGLLGNLNVGSLYWSNPSTGIFNIMIGVVPDGFGSQFLFDPQTSPIPFTIKLNAGFRIADTDLSHYLTFKPGSNLTANRTLTFTTGDADRTLTLSANVTLNQSVATNSSPTFANITDSGLTASKVVFSSGSKVLTSTGIGTSAQFIKGDGSLDSSTYLTTESDPVFTASEAASFVSGDKANLDNQSGTNTGDQTYIPPRVGTTATVDGSGNITPTGDSSDMYTVTALDANATILAPTGTPTDGQKLLLRILDNGTARTLTWNAIYRGINLVLPATTVVSETMYIQCIYNSADSKWDVVAA